MLNFIAKIKNTEWLAVGLIVLLGFGLRIINIGAEQYWFDEILSLLITKTAGSISGIIHFVGVGEYHPPLYYIILHFWINSVGESETAVRSLSLIFGLGSMVLFYFWAKILTNKNIALLAVFLLSINPLHIEYSQEARPYAIFCFFGLVAVYALTRLFTEKKWFWYVIYILFNILGLYTHYSYIFIFSALVSFQFYLALSGRVVNKEWKISWRELVWTNMAVVLGFLPWLPYFFTRFFESGLDFWGSKSALPTAVINQVWFENIFSSLLWPQLSGYSRYEVLGILLGKVALLALVISIIVKLTRQGKSFFKDKNIFLLSLLIIPIVLFFFSGYSYNYTLILSRHALFCVFPLLILLSWMLGEINKFGKIAIIILLYISLIFPLLEILNNDSNWDKDHRYKQVINYVEQRARPGDAVLFSNHLMRIGYLYYQKKDLPVEYFFPEMMEEKIPIDKNQLTASQNKMMVHSLIFKPVYCPLLLKQLNSYNRIFFVQTGIYDDMNNCFLNNGWHLKEKSSYSGLSNVFPIYLFERL